MRTQRANIYALALCLVLSIASPFSQSFAVVQDAADVTIESADLPMETDDAATGPSGELEVLWQEASQKCSSLEQIDSVPLFTELIARLENKLQTGELAEVQQPWLREALFCRAEAQFNLRNIDEATADLRRILELDPGTPVDSRKSSTHLTALLEEIRSTTVGSLLLLATEMPASVSLDGVEISPFPLQPLPLLAGRHIVRASRPGFSSFEEEIEVPPAETVSLTLALERSSAVFEFELTPCDAHVELDGEMVGQVSPAGDDTEDPESPCRFVISGVDTGERVVAISSEGHRRWERRVEVAELADYQLPPVSLVPTSGWVTIAGLPPGLDFVIDGRHEKGPASATQASSTRLELPTGPHQLLVDLGSVGLFAERFELEDQQEKIIQVDLQPTLAYLGIVGGDNQSQMQLEQWLQAAFEDIDGLQVRKANCDVPELFQKHGITSSRLRDLVTAQPMQDKPWDENLLRKDLDERCAASLYLLTVLPDDPLPVAVDVWIWSASPGPAAQVLPIELPPGPSWESLVAGLTTRIRLSHSWIGLQVVDSLLTDGPVVVSVASAGPADTAGLQPGDQLLEIGGEAISSRRQLQEWIDTTAPGSALTVGFRRGTVSQEAVIEAASAPTIHPLLAAGSLPAAVSAQLSLLAWTGGLAEPWVLDLNRAAVLMASGEWALAARDLGRIEAPKGAGLSQGTVDYLLARALLNSGSDAYRDRTITALTSAADSEGARLGSHDGPLVAPRARIRLRELTATADSVQQ